MNRIGRGLLALFCVLGISSPLRAQGNQQPLLVFDTIHELVEKGNPRNPAQNVVQVLGYDLIFDGGGGTFIATNTVASTNTTTRIYSGVSGWSWELIFGTPTPGGTGEANTAANLGTGSGLFNQKIGVQLQFNSLAASGGLQWSSNANVLTVSGPVVSVMDPAYGAIPNDGLDDSAAIQAAIDATPSGGGVYVPPGDFHAARLLIDKPIRFFGDGNRSRLVLSASATDTTGDYYITNAMILTIQRREDWESVKDNTYTETISAEGDLYGVSVENLWFDGGGRTNHGGGIHLVGVERSALADLFFHALDGPAILCQSTRESRFSRIWTMNCGSWKTTGGRQPYEVFGYLPYSGETDLEGPNMDTWSSCEVIYPYAWSMRIKAQSSAASTSGNTRLISLIDCRFHGLNCVPGFGDVTGTDGAADATAGTAYTTYNTIEYPRFGTSIADFNAWKAQYEYPHLMVEGFTSRILVSHCQFETLPGTSSYDIHFERGHNNKVVNCTFSGKVDGVANDDSGAVYFGWVANYGTYEMAGCDFEMPTSGATASRLFQAEANATVNAHDNTHFAAGIPLSDSVNTVSKTWDASNKRYRLRLGTGYDVDYWDLQFSEDEPTTKRMGDIWLDPEGYGTAATRTAAKLRLNGEWNKVALETRLNAAGYNKTGDPLAGDLFHSTTLQTLRVYDSVNAVFKLAGQSGGSASFLQSLDSGFNYGGLSLWCNELQSYLVRDGLGVWRSGGLQAIGTTAQRPTGFKPFGFRYFDTDLSAVVEWDGNSWETPGVQPARYIDLSTISTNGATEGDVLTYSAGTLGYAASGGGGGGSGDMVGPAGATDNAVARFDGTTGKLIQDSGGVTIDDIDNLTTDGSLIFENLLIANNATSPAQITADQNDYKPLTNITTVRLTSDAPRSITGLNGSFDAGPVYLDGIIRVIHNVGSFAITLKNESASSTANHRFALNGDVMIKPNQSFALRYDLASNRWRALSDAMPGSGGTNLSTIYVTDTEVENPNFENGTNIIWAVSGTNVFAFPTNIVSSQVTDGALTADDLEAGALGTRLLSDGTDADWFSEQNWFTFFDEFLVSGSGAVGETGWSTSLGSGGVASAGDAEQGAPGIQVLSTGTSGTGFAQLVRGSFTSSVLFGGGIYIFEARIKLPALSDETETYGIKLGWLDGWTVSDGIYFYYSSTVNSGQWRGVAANNSVLTEVDSAVAVTTGWTKVKIVVAADGSSAEFFVDDVSIGTASSNIPTATGRETSPRMALLKSAGTTARTVQIDFTKLSFKPTTPR